MQGHQQNAGYIRHQTVDILIISLQGKALAPVILCDFPDVAGMGLIRKDDILRLSVERQRRPTIILPHRRRIILSGKTQVHGGIRSLAYTADTGSKAVFCQISLRQQGEGYHGKLLSLYHLL